MGQARDLVKWWACMELDQGAAAEAANFQGPRRGEERRGGHTQDTGILGTGSRTGMWAVC